MKASRKLSRFYETVLPQVIQNHASVFFREVIGCLNCNLRMLGRFIWIVYARKVTYFPASGPCIHALTVALLTFFQRSIDKDLDKIILANHVAHVIPGGTVRTYGGAYGDSSMPYDLGGDKPDAPNV